MAGISVGGGSQAATTPTAFTNPGASAHIEATAAGNVAAGMHSVTFRNDGAVNATVAGQTLLPAATVAWTDPPLSNGFGLGAIAYDPGVGGLLHITTQGYPT